MTEYVQYEGKNIGVIWFDEEYHDWCTCLLNGELETGGLGASKQEMIDCLIEDYLAEGADQ